MPAIAESPISATLPLPGPIFMPGESGEIIRRFNAATVKLNHFVEAHVRSGFAPIEDLTEWRRVLKENLTAGQKAKRHLKAKKRDKSITILYNLLQIMTESADRAARDYSKSPMKKRVRAFHLYDGLSFDF